MDKRSFKKCTHKKTLPRYSARTIYDTKLPIFKRYWVESKVYYAERRNMNEGKKFEEDFKNSVPEDYFYYRFRDGTSSWDGGNARFQAKNICDCMIMGFDILWLIELKSFKGKSFPFGNLDLNNLDKMIEAQKKKKSRVNAIIVFNFRDLEETYMVHCDFVKHFIQNTDRKSIPISWFRDEILADRIPQTRKRTRYTYDLSEIR